VLGLGFVGDDFPYGGKFTGLSFPGGILHWGDLTELLYEILLFFVLLCLGLLNFACREIPGESSEGNFQRVLISRNDFQGKGNFRSIPKND